ncbi:GH17586 [Drosophila grimshawi]|uniref:GH17586 n=1 Tax=Drosophila grimshawi TaxID=7222 RepID=B4JXD9_DROGR|nr:GH17586 [Drosophila grimshawi]
MSYIGNASDLECEKNEFPRPRPTGIVTKMAAHKLSSEPKWADKREDDSDSEVSSPDNFLTKDDYQAVFKKGFHKVTGARFYRKIAIPCRPRKTFTLYVLDVPEDLPVEDIRHAMYKFDSVVEVVRLHIYSSPGLGGSSGGTGSGGGGGDKGVEGEQLTHSIQSPSMSMTMSTSLSPGQTQMQTLRRAAIRSSSAKSVVGGIVGDAIEKAERPERRELPPAVIRITLASMDEYNILLQNGLNFYDATFFPTDANISLKGAKIDYKRRMLDGSIPGRVRELLPVFDAAGFCKLPPPTSKLIKPPRS